MLLENGLFLGLLTVLLPYGLFLFASALRTVGSQLSDYERIVFLDEPTSTRIPKGDGGCGIAPFFDTERVQDPALKIRSIARAYIIIVPVLRLLAFAGPALFVLSVLIYLAYAGGVLVTGWDPTHVINVLTILSLVVFVAYLVIKAVSKTHEHLILLHPKYQGAPPLPVLLELIPLWRTYERNR
jgi:hypothetical protein